jgi:hypothetical protein
MGIEASIDSLVERMSVVEKLVVSLAGPEAIVACGDTSTMISWIALRAGIEERRLRPNWDRHLYLCSLYGPYSKEHASSRQKDIETNIPVIKAKLEPVIAQLNSLGANIVLENEIK